MSDVTPEKEEADDRFAASTELTATLLKSAQDLAEKHKAWASDLADKENAIRAEGEQLKKTTMEEFEAMKASLLAELEVAKTDLAGEKAAWEAECERVSRTQEFEPRIKLDVGGVKFTTLRSTLQAVPGSMLEALFSGRHKNEPDEEGYHFIDRDGTHFRHILNFLRDQKNFTVELSKEHVRELFAETEYYGLSSAMAPTCPALAELWNQKQQSWIGDLEESNVVCYQLPDDVPRFFFVVTPSYGGVECGPIALDILSVDIQNNDKGELLTRLRDLKRDLGVDRSIQESLNEDGPDGLDHYGLVYEIVDITWVDGCPVFPEDNKKLRHVTGVETSLIT